MDTPAGSGRHRDPPETRVIKVTNLNTEGSGSLRAALETEGPRVVVFEVSGNIDFTPYGYLAMQPDERREQVGYRSSSRASRPDMPTSIPSVSAWEVTADTLAPNILSKSPAGMMTHASPNRSNVSMFK